MKSENKQSTEIGLTGLTFLIFLTLKLTNNIDWSWWWVTAPLWGWIPLVSLVIIAAVLVAWVKDKRRTHE